MFANIIFFRSFVIPIIYSSLLATMKNRIFTFLLLISSTLIAQIRVGEWRDHLNYNSLIDLIEKDDRIIVASTTALFYLNKTTKELKRFSTLDGLSETEISSLAYDKSRDLIIIGYQSGNIDVITKGVIKNVPEILNTTNITGNKTINHIFLHENYALLSCNFGIIKFDLNKIEVSDTYKLGTNNTNKSILQTTIFKDTIYAATDHGLFKAPTNHPLLSFSDNWSKYSFNGLLPDSSFINAIASTTDYMMFNVTNKTSTTNEKQYILENNSLILSPSNNIFRVTALKSQDNKILLTGQFYARLYNTSTDFVHFINHDDLRLTNSIVTKDGKYWCTDEFLGLIHANFWDYTSYFPHGPKSTDVSKLTSDHGKIIITHGGKLDSYTPMYSKDNFSVYANNIWTFYPIDPVINERDITAIAQDPLNSDKQWSGTWGTGLLKYTNYTSPELFTVANTDSTLAPRDFGGGDQYLLSDLKFDDKGTLWVLSSQSSSPLVSKDKNDHWEAHGFGSLLPTSVHTKKLEIFNSLNQKWVITNGDGIIVFDESQNGVKLKKLKTSNGSGNLASLKTNCATIDKNGKVWIGTEEGLSVISSPRNIFTGGDYDANHVLVYFDGNWEPVLKGQYITDIEIDGGNRKWFATKQGVFLISEDGTEQIKHFTTENSPLFSNTVIDIAIDHKTGEVFFATEKGVVSYRSSAQELEESERDVFVFPNPVQPEYSGLITIDGLISNSTVKIADVSGRIVYQTKAEGNRAVWDGRSLQNERVSSGVYIVYSASSDGEFTEVAKLSIVR